MRFGHSKKEKTPLRFGLSSPLDLAMNTNKEMFVRTGVVEVLNYNSVYFILILIYNLVYVYKVEWLNWVNPSEQRSSCVGREAALFLYGMQ